MNACKQFKFLPYNLNLANKKEFLHIQKRQPKIKSLVVPIKGTSNLTEYAINGILKSKKPNLSAFKTLSKVKVQYVSQEFLTFFAKNKQILRTVKTFKGNFSDLSHERALTLSLFLNRMKDLTTFDDMAKFSIKRTLKAKVYSFTFPGNLSSKKKAKTPTPPKIEEQNLLLKRVLPLQKIKHMQYSPNLDFKRLFPSVKTLELDASFLKKLSEIKPGKIKDLVITDDNAENLDKDTIEDSCQALERFKSLKTVRLSITDSDNEDLLKIIENLPKREFDVYLDCNPNIVLSNEEYIDLITNFAEETGSKVFFLMKNWPEVDVYKELLETVSNHEGFQLVMPKIFFDTSYSLELQSLVVDVFVSAKVSFEKVMIKLSFESNKHERKEVSGSLKRLFQEMRASPDKFKDFELIYDFESMNIPSQALKEMSLLKPIMLLK